MHNWRILETVYLYDGTIEGLITISYKCLKEKIIPKDIVYELEYQENLLDYPVFIESNIIHFNEIINGLKQINEENLYYVFTSFLSGRKEKEMAIIKYIIYCFKYGKKVNYMKSLEPVIDIQAISKNVGWETHRFKGFLRFTLINNQFLYATLEPDNNIIESLSRHFQRRLPNESWIIHDLKRKVAIVYDKKNLQIINAEELIIENPNESDNFEKMWKRYFKTIAIKERTNRRCQRQFMPKKYWKYIVETR